MNWFFLILLSVFLVSCSNILQRVLMKGDKSDPKSFTIIFCLMIGCFNLVFAFFHGFYFPHFGANLIFFLVSSFLWAMATLLVFKSLQTLESSEVIIITSVRAVISILASIVFLHETFNIQKSIGTLLILSSVLLVTNVKKGIKVNTGLWYALGSALCGGFAVVIDGFNVRNYDPISFLIIENFLMAFIMLVLFPKSIKQMSVIMKTNFLKKMIPLAIFSFLQAIVFYFALAVGPVSQIAPINQAQVIVTVLFAAILLRERDHLFYKVIASILVMVGVILLH